METKQEIEAREDMNIEMFTSRQPWNPGLANNGKYVSARHQEAKKTGMLTAGEFAKLLTKKFFIKISADEIKDWATEWHHSGFYRANGRGKKIMGRTFFFDPEEAEAAEYYLFKVLAERGDAENRQFEAEKVKDVPWYAISDYWDHDYSGRYGKKKYFKRLRFHTGTGIVPSGFVPITAEEYETHNHRDSEQLPAYTNLLTYL